MNWPDESCWTLLTFCRKHPYIFSEYEILIFWEPYSKGTGTKHSALCTPKVTIPAMQWKDCVLMSLEVRLRALGMASVSWEVVDLLVSRL